MSSHCKDLENVVESFERHRGLHICVLDYNEAKRCGLENYLCQRGMPEERQPDLLVIMETRALLLELKTCVKTKNFIRLIDYVKLALEQLERGRTPEDLKAVYMVIVFSKRNIKDRVCKAIEEHGVLGDIAECRSRYSVVSLEQLEHVAEVFWWGGVLPCCS